MNRTKWAPGPWRLHIVDDTTIIDASGRFVAQCMSTGHDLAEDDYNNPNEWPRLEANARLIAGAPDLYEALASFPDPATFVGLPGGLTAKTFIPAVLEWRRAAAAILAKIGGHDE